MAGRADVEGACAGAKQRPTLVETIRAVPAPAKSAPNPVFGEVVPQHGAKTGRQRGNPKRR
ncbi:MAG: hypothetical protein E5Y65_03025 [Mesorhizobium sp.]|jgi:hypothetical protein|uniref:hypothetical protein n=1 Tax=Mesorhizobium TaxID=68287 RepID=UPI001226B95E|nr:hypothetical protein [Mesorhizobium sp.]TIL76322.1 MAG: hypothetical protein E5Y70_03485 [Mesorhizobium sp.]TIL93975.1 MAG: hypothetical protein E5Y65_03025 [Mesorhizobium sp.]TIM02411.1 MAG: hypothetical protein E5Y64_08290 [Mesorhizobium sp.]